MTLQEHKTLTPRQSEILAFIAFEIETECAPTYEEIADKFGLQINGVYEHVQKIIEKGHLSASRGKARSFRIVPCET